MVRYYLVAVVMAVILTSFLGDRVSAPSAPTNGGREVSQFEETSGKEEEAASSGADGGLVALQRNSDGHFYANVDVNGAPVRFLVDTGASGIALTRADARRASLAVSSGMPLVIGRGVNGDVRGERVMLGRVSLGTRTMEQIPAVILDVGDQSLLGQSFLREFDTVEIQGNTMILR